MQPITWMPDRGWGPAATRSWRGHLSALLLSTGGRLIRWAWHLAPASAQTAGRHETEIVHLEFSPLSGHAGGAIYRNGQLVGTLAGVQRL